MRPRTMYEKIWESHLAYEAPGEPALIYIDRHFIHEGTSPQAFAGLKSARRKVRRHLVYDCIKGRRWTKACKPDKLIQ